MQCSISQIHKYITATLGTVEFQTGNLRGTAADFEDYLEKEMFYVCIVLLGQQHTTTSWLDKS